MVIFPPAIEYLFYNLSVSPSVANALSPCCLLPFALLSFLFLWFLRRWTIFARLSVYCIIICCCVYGLFCVYMYITYMVSPSSSSFTQATSSCILTTLPGGRQVLLSFFAIVSNLWRYMAHLTLGAHCLVFHWCAWSSEALVNLRQIFFYILYYRISGFWAAEFCLSHLL